MNSSVLYLSICSNLHNAEWITIYFVLKGEGLVKSPHLQWTTIGWVLVLLCTLVTSSMTSVMVFRLEHLPSGSQFIMWNCVTWWVFPDCSVRQNILTLEPYTVAQVQKYRHCHGSCTEQSVVRKLSYNSICNWWVLQLDWVLSYLCQYCSDIQLLVVLPILQTGVTMLKNFALLKPKPSSTESMAFMLWSSTHACSNWLYSIPWSGWCWVSW